MQPSYLSLVQIFGAPARYTVPLFQRPYVWGKDEQWEPLWSDIANLADRVLAAEPGKPVAGHFLGTVVLEQAMTPSGTIGCREIIDGQQRLTTLQILLKAAEHVLAEVAAKAEQANDEATTKSARVAARQLAILTGNTAYADDEEKYKVWPTNDDRAAFREVLDASGANALEAAKPRMADAYRFFSDSARDWLGLGTDTGTRSMALAAALQTHLRLIVLDLEDSDEPQAIFETLNAHGTPLLPADLIKNWLLWEASRQKLTNTEALYQTWWRPFDREPDYWRVNVGTGHAARPRVDMFLQNWLTRRTGEPVAVKHLYNRFLDHVAPRKTEPAPEPCAVPALMADIHDDGRRYREIVAPAGTTRFDTFLHRLAVMDFVVFHPVLLALMGRPGSDQADRDAAAVALESYLVRRVVCWEQTRGYGEVMRGLLTAIAAVDPSQPVSAAIAVSLGGHAADANRWPDDKRFRNAWVSNKFYEGYRRSRVRMILQAIEEFYLREGTKGEPVVAFDFSALEIEHILPQKWEQHWPAPADAKTRDERDRRLHGIGNLTLVTAKLNPTLSNAHWLDSPSGMRGKRTTFDHSKLQMNARLVKTWADDWNHATIEVRAGQLFEAARQIWPPPPGANSTA